MACGCPSSVSVLLLLPVQQLLHLSWSLAVALSSTSHVLPAPCLVGSSVPCPGLCVQLCGTPEVQPSSSRLLEMLNISHRECVTGASLTRGEAPFPTPVQVTCSLPPFLDPMDLLHNQVLQDRLNTKGKHKVLCLKNRMKGFPDVVSSLLPARAFLFAV